MSKYTEMSNQELMEELDWCGWDTYYDDYRRYVVEEIERRLNLPTIEIVHCRDCKHYVSDGGAIMECEIYEVPTEDNHYCSYGERIDNE